MRNLTFLPFALAIAALFVLFGADAARAQIAPECAGVVVPQDYDEARQQSHLQNYFAASFLLTPMAPPVTSSDAEASIGLEIGFIPPVSCEGRLVLGGTKTENTNRSPVSPRPRVRAQLPAFGPVSSHVGFTFLPPLPTPVGTLLQAGGEVGAGWRSTATDGTAALSLGARAHLDFARMRADIASAFDPKAPAVDDLFFASSLGLDFGVGYEMPITEWLALTSYLSAGIADVSTLFLVGDDGVLVENTDTPWSGALASAGLRALAFEHVELVVEGSWAVPIYATVKTKLAVVW